MRLLLVVVAVFDVDEVVVEVAIKLKKNRYYYN